MHITSDIKQLLKEALQKGFFNLLTANVLIQFVAFASQLIVAGILSPDDVGRIKILQTWLGIFTIIGGMGLGSSVLKLCSEHRPAEEVRRIFKSGIVFSLVTTVGTYCLVLIINCFGLISTDLLIRSLVPLAMLPLVSNTFFSLYVCYYQARKEIKFISNITSINKIFSVLLILFFTFQLGIKGYYIGANIALIVLLAVIVGVRKLPLVRLHSLRPPANHLQMHWKYAHPAFWANLLAVFTAYGDVLLINYFIKDSEGVGFYSFALTLTVIFQVLPATVQQITIPYFSGLSANRFEFIRAFWKYAKILVIIVLATLIVTLIVFPPIINFIFENKFAPSMRLYFLPLAIGWSIRQCNQIQAAALFGLGKIEQIAKIQLYSLPFIVAVTYLSLHFWGLIGAAYASIPCSIFCVSMGYYFYRKAIV